MIDGVRPERGWQPAGRRYLDSVPAACGTPRLTPGRAGEGQCEPDRSAPQAARVYAAALPNERERGLQARSCEFPGAGCPA
jgi:hypothetical protein